MDTRVGWCIGAVVISACASFKNVDATAKLGIALGDQPIVASQWLAECEAVLAAVPNPRRAAMCRGKDKRYENMVIAVRDASELVQQYATALSAAANKTDVAIADHANALLTQIGAMNTAAMKASTPALANLAAVVANDSPLVGKLTPTGVVTIVDTVVSFASQSYRRGAIAAAVTKASSHVDALVAFIEAEVQLHRADVINLRDVLHNEVSAQPLIETTPAVGQMLALTVATLDTRIAALDQLDLACQSFRVAHGKLAQRIHDEKPWQNEEMIAELRLEIAKIVTALHGGSASASAASSTALTTARP